MRRDREKSTSRCLCSIKDIENRKTKEEEGRSSKKKRLKEKPKKFAN